MTLRSLRHLTTNASRLSSTDGEKLSSLQRVQTSLAVLIAGKQVWDHAEAWYSKHKDKKLYQITISDKQDEDLYSRIIRWLIAQTEIKDHHIVRAVLDWDNSINARRVFTEYAGINRLAVDINGVTARVTVKSNEEESSKKMGLDESWAGGYMRIGKPEETITFSVSTARERAVILKFLERFNDTKADRALYVSSSYEWNNVGALRRRPLSSVVLREGLLEDIIEDMQEFINAEERYARLGTPYHRSYLLHGPPGTGKTSTATAIADHFKMNIYFLTLPDIENDSRFSKMIGEVKQKSILVMEDIDVVKATLDRDGGSIDSKKTLSLSALLNGLDGITAPHGLITIMTTNHADRLDSALTRPGRVDRKILIDYLDSDQLNRLMVATIGLELHVPVKVDILPAQVIGILKTHMHDTDAAVRAVRDYVERANAKGNAHDPGDDDPELLPFDGREPLNEEPYSHVNSNGHIHRTSFVGLSEHGGAIKPLDPDHTTN